MRPPCSSTSLRATARPTPKPGGVSGAAREELEHAVQQRGLDAATGIRYRDHGLPVVDREGHDDTAPRLGVLRRIREQVHEHLLQPHVIRIHARRLTGYNDAGDRGPAR